MAPLAPTCPHDPISSHDSLADASALTGVLTPRAGARSGSPKCGRWFLPAVVRWPAVALVVALQVLRSVEAAELGGPWPQVKLLSAKDVVLGGALGTALERGVRRR